MSLITVGSGMPDSDIEPGIYPATVIGLRADTIVVDGEEKEVFVWTFSIPTEDEGAIELEGLTSQIVTPRSKAYAYLVALLGQAAVGTGAGFNDTDLVGKNCLVTVDLNKNGYTRVSNITAAPRGAIARPAPAQAAVAAAPAAPAAPAVSPLRPTVRAAAGVSDDEADLPF